MTVTQLFDWLEKQGYVDNGDCYVLGDGESKFVIKKSTAYMFNLLSGPQGLQAVRQEAEEAVKRHASADMAI